MYFQCALASKKSRTTNILFYTLSILYVLSTFNFVTDLVVLVLEVSKQSYLFEYQFFINKKILFCRSDRLNSKLTQIH